MQLKPGTFAMTVLLASLSALGPFSTDTYLASLPHIGAELNAPSDQVQLTLSAYLIGFSFGQIVYGPIADKYGRKPVMIVGLCGYVLAAIFCTLATSVTMLIVARTIQSFAAAAPIILARAVVRDLFEGQSAARELSVMTSISGMMPVAAPILGGVLQVAFGWRSVFVTMTIGGLVLLTVVALLLPETLRHRQEGPLSFRSVLASFGIVGRNRAFRAYVGIQAMGFAGLFCFISASPFILQNLYGFPPLQFSLTFACASICFLAATFVNRRLTPRFGIDGTIGIGTAFLMAGGLLQLVGVLLLPQSPIAFFVPGMVFFAGIGLLLPLLVASALMPFPERAGAASSLMGLCQMVFAAVVGAVLSRMIVTSALPLAIVMAAMGIAAFAIFHTSHAVRLDPANKGAPKQ